MNRSIGRSTGLSALSKSNRNGNDTVFISWVRFHGRSLSLAHEWGSENVFIHSALRPTVLRYLVQSWKTALLLRSRRPRIVFLMLPPLPALLIVLAFTRRSRTRVVADLHSGVFNDPKWRWATAMTLGLLKAPNMALVTNRTMLEACLRAGVPALILHDPVEESEHHQIESMNAPEGATTPSILVPLSYAPDEPVQQILQAARALSQYQWRFTGTPPSSLVAGAPPNVEFTGFVSNAEYAGLLAQCSVLVALTTRSNTMQRAAYEALAAAKPLVTSPQDVLVEYFGDSATYAPPTPEGIAAAVVQAMERKDSLVTRMRIVAQEKRTEQESTMATLRATLGLAP